MTRKRPIRGSVEPKPKPNRDGVLCWYGRFKDGGKKRRRCIGPVSQYTKNDAKDRLRDVIIPAYFAEKEGRALESTPKSPIRGVPTWEQACLNYLDLRESTWSKSSNRTFRSLFKQHIIPALGRWTDGGGKQHNLLVTDIRPSQVQALFNSVSAEGGGRRYKDERADATVKRPDMASHSLLKKVITHTRAVFDMLIDDDILTKNPARAKTLKRPRSKKPSKWFLSMKEIEALLRTAMCRSYRDYIIIRTDLTCGLRPSELFALRVEDLLEGRLTIDETTVLGEIKEEGKTAGATTIPIPMPALLQQQLKHYIRHEGIIDPRDFLFASEVGTVMSHDNYLDRVLKPLGKAAGIKRPVTFQVLRRTTGTHFQNYGEVKDTQALLRHSDPQTTLREYQQTITENLARATNKWDQALVEVTMNDGLPSLGGAVQ